MEGFFVVVVVVFLFVFEGESHTVEATKTKKCCQRQRRSIKVNLTPNQGTGWVIFEEVSGSHCAF